MKLVVHLRPKGAEPVVEVYNAGFATVRIQDGENTEIVIFCADRAKAEALAAALRDADR